jgi:hypothetical protein
MTQAKAKALLLKAFSVLNKRHRANFRWHLKQGTRVLCGKQASAFVLHGGG